MKKGSRWNRETETGTQTCEAAGSCTEVMNDSYLWKPLRKKTEDNLFCGARAAIVNFVI